MLLSGGVECDFGALKDVLKSKKAMLGQGFVEVKMMWNLLVLHVTDVMNVILVTNVTQCKPGAT